MLSDRYIKLVPAVDPELTYEPPSGPLRHDLGALGNKFSKLCEIEVSGNGPAIELPYIPAAVQEQGGWNRDPARNTPICTSTDPEQALYLTPAPLAIDRKQSSPPRNLAIDKRHTHKCFLSQVYRPVWALESETALGLGSRPIQSWSRDLSNDQTRDLPRT